MNKIRYFKIFEFIDIYFILLIKDCLNKLPQNVVIELSWQESKSSRKSYVGWSGNHSKQSGTIEIDPQFGTAIGLHDGQKVIDFILIIVYLL